MYKYIFDNIKNINKHLRQFKKTILCLVFLNIVDVLLSIGIPLLNMKVVNEFVYNKVSIGHLKIVFLYILVLLLSTIINYISSIVQRANELSMERNIRETVINQMIHKNLCEYGETEMGNIDTTLKYDVTIFVEIYLQMVIEIPLVIVRLCSIWGILFYLGWDIALLVLAMQLIAAIFQKKMNVRLEDISESVRNRLMMWNEQISNIISSMNVIRHIGAEKYLVRKYNDYSNQYINQSMRHCKMSAFTNNIIEIFLDINIIVILCIGSLKVFNGNLGVGVLISLVQYATSFFGSISALLSTISEMHAERSQVEHIVNIFAGLKLEENAYEAKKECNIRKIIISDVTFKYPEGELLLDKCNAEFEVGRLNFIIGSSGSGKTTLIKLLEDEYTLIDGQIYGITTKADTKEKILPYISVVPQKSIFYTDTVYNNVTLAQDFSEKKINDICKKCYIYDEIMSMPEQFNTILSCGKDNLSGGQLKRLSLARSLAQNKRILLLDEPTAGLDEKNAMLVMKTLRKYAKDKIIVIVSHDLSVIRNGDKVYKIKNKKMICDSVMC